MLAEVPAVWPFTKPEPKIDTAAAAPAEARSLSDPDAWLFEYPS
ncbi:hypothetical protein RGUI_1704 [Rhodovulum sp. P5]|nr:hypothetical protein RGUI_1704 [Rhodovulum sp. P5]